MTAEAAFEAGCRNAGIPYEWRTKRAFDNVVSPHAGGMTRAAELILCPAVDPLGCLGRHRIEEVVFASGRSVIGVPADWGGEKIGRGILVAWDGGRQAARAVFDALPVLRQADAIRVVSLKGFSEEPVRQFTLADDICVKLSWLGLRAESHTFASSRGSVRDELKTQALDFGADLMVMGCYGAFKVP